MDTADEVWTGDAEQLVIALQVPVVVAPAFAAKIRFTQALLLDHRAHRPIEEQDARLQQRSQRQLNSHKCFQSTQIV